MNKEALLNQELYFIKSNLTEAPHFVNSEFFVLFTNKALAIDFAQRISQRLKPYYSVGVAPVSACVITDNNLFFQEMMSIGFSKFSFNSEGTIFDLNSIYGRENKVNPEEKELYIYYMGHVKMQKSSHIGSVKTQKIASAKQYLRAGNNPKMMQRFIESQKKLRLYYKSVSSEDTNVSLRPQETYVPQISSSNNIGTHVNGVINPNYDKKMSYGKLSRNWGIASIFLYAWIFPPIVAIVYGIRSILYTKSINEPIDKKAIWGLALSGFGLFMLYAAIMGGMFNS